MRKKIRRNIRKQYTWTGIVTASVLSILLWGLFFAAGVIDVVMILAMAVGIYALVLIIAAFASLFRNMSIRRRIKRENAPADIDNDTYVMLNEDVYAGNQWLILRKHTGYLPVYRKNIREVHLHGHKVILERINPEGIETFVCGSKNNLDQLPILLYDFFTESSGQPD